MRWWDGSQWTDRTQTSAQTATADERPWFKKKRVLIPAALVALLIFGAAFGSTEVDAPVASENSSPSAESSEAPADEEPVKEAAPVAEEPVEEEPAEPALTPGQENALAAAEQYLDFTAFSRSGLIEQLEFDEYSTEDATFAADRVGADWSEQAVRSAKEYLDFSPFSRGGLIEQLEFDGYSQSEAEAGASGAGL